MMVNEKGIHLLSIKDSRWVLCTVMQSPPLPTAAVQNSHQNANTAGKLGDTNRYFYQSLYAQIGPMQQSLSLISIIMHTRCLMWKSMVDPALLHLAELRLKC